MTGDMIVWRSLIAAFKDNVAASPPLTLHNATCEIATDYTKRKNVLRLRLGDGSEYLINANDKNEMVEWLNRIKFYSGKLFF